MSVSERTRSLAIKLVRWQQEMIWKCGRGNIKQTSATLDYGCVANVKRNLVIVFSITMTKFQKKWENNVGGAADDDGHYIPAKTFSFVMQ